MPQSKRTAAERADLHDLYQKAVQTPDAEIDFVDSAFRKLSRRTASRLREDFCGTAYTACEWVRRRRTNSAVGVDLDRPTLDWGIEHNLAQLTPSARQRLTLLERNVLDPGPKARRMDIVLAMNFSWWILKDRQSLLRYFRSVRDSLVSDGVFFLDIYGGYESLRVQRETTKYRAFTYIWHQAAHNPITNEMTCHIGFRFPDGSAIPKAFSYDWRIYSLAEARDILAEAGFSATTVYWEGDDGKGGGNGVFEPATIGEPDAAWIAYIAAQR